MTQTVGAGEMCRLTVYGPDSRIELAVPAHVPVADLMPTLLSHLGQRLATEGLAHSGWVLQRLGEPALDEDLPPAALGLYDGDIVYLRSRDDQLSPVDFDDLVDGVARGVDQFVDRWRPDHGRRLALSCGTIALLTVLLVLPPLGSGRTDAVVAGFIALLVLGCGIAASRAFANVGAGQLLVVACLPFGALAGAAVPRGARTPHWSDFSSAPSLLAAATCVATLAVVARFAAGRFPAGLTATAICAALVAAAAAVDAATSLTAPGSAAVLLAVSIALSYSVPMMSAKIVGVAVPLLPTTGEEFQSDLDPEPGQQVVEKARSGYRYVTDFYLGLSAVCAGAMIVVSAGSGWGRPTLVAAAVAILVLSCRELISVRQRAALVGAGAVGLVSLVTRLSIEGAIPDAIVIVAMMLVALWSCATAAWWPGRRLIPHWGLAGDIAYWLAAIALVPAVLAMTGVYSVVRSLF